jgi:PD-(D/E)XK nuclease superfamily
MEEAQSPFLPGTNIQYALDSTSLGYLKTCPRLYQYVIIDGWAGKGESIHLRFGGEYHQALQEYEQFRAQGIAHETAIHQAVHALMQRTADWKVNRETKAGHYKNRDTLVALVIDYLDHYGADDPAQTYIREDGRAAVELSFRFELDFGPRCGNVSGTQNPDRTWTYKHEQPYILCGHLDRVVNFNDALMVMDHKTTTTTLGENFFDQWEPNNQMTLYTLAGKVVLDAPIRGVVISGAQIMLDKPNRFVRGFTYRTQDQLDEWLGDLGILLRTAETYAEEGHWPMNDTSCDKYGGCVFRGICSKSPAVREKFLAADFIKLPESERWNPLKPR